MAVIDLTIPLTLSDTLGSLLGSVINAQSQAARATVEFIQEIGTIEGTESESGVEHQLRNIRFAYRKLNENAEMDDFILEVPLLSLVEIPLVSVKSAKFNLRYDITSTTESSLQKADTSNPKPTLPNTIPKHAKIKGRIQKSLPTETKETGGLSVEIELEKSSLPIGVERIYDILELTASEFSKNE